MKTLTVIALVSLAGILGSMDMQDAEADRANYCDQVAMWHTDADRGIPEHDRAGWPPFEGECK